MRRPKHPPRRIGKSFGPFRYDHGVLQTPFKKDLTHRAPKGLVWVKVTEGERIHLAARGGLYDEDVTLCGRVAVAPSLPPHKALDPGHKWSACTSCAIVLESRNGKALPQPRR